MNQGNFNEQDKQELGTFDKNKAWNQFSANLHMF